jgi:protein translocase SecG subunit
MSLISVLQIIVNLLLVAAIMVQTEGKGLSPVVSANQFYGTKRGAEKVLFGATIILAVLFLGLSLTAYIS